MVMTTFKIALEQVEYFCLMKCVEKLEITAKIKKSALFERPLNVCTNECTYIITSMLCLFCTVAIKNYHLQWLRRKGKWYVSNSKLLSSFRH